MSACRKMMAAKMLFARFFGGASTARHTFGERPKGQHTPGVYVPALTKLGRCKRLVAKFFVFICFIRTYVP